MPGRALNHCALLAAFCLISSVPAAKSDGADGKAKANASPEKLQQRTTAGGVSFVMRGDPGPRPKPVIVCLAQSGAETLQTEPYAASGRELVRNGWLAVSLDIPGHGGEHRQGEPPGIEAWRVRIQKGQPFVDELARRVSAVLDHLILEKAIDPARIAIEGTSRGGFLAAHVAAREPRFKAVVMYAPVTNLELVTEFQPVKDHPGQKALALSHYAEKLADRRIWLVIGNSDGRVGTDSAIQFTREMVRAATRRKIPASVTLHVLATPGHASDASMHLDAVSWLQKQFPAAAP